MRPSKGVSVHILKENGGAREFGHFMPVGVQTAATGTFRTHLDAPSTITSHPRTHFNARFGLRRDSAPLGIPPTTTTATTTTTAATTATATTATATATTSDHAVLELRGYMGREKRLGKLQGG